MPNTAAISDRVLRIAKKVRDRWIREAVPLIRPMTPTRPFRK